jgi:hypothetical protein
MNDLKTLRAALSPAEVPQDVVDRSRHRLQNRMLAAPRRRVRPLALGAGLVAAAAAAAVVVATLPGTPAPAPSPQAEAPVVVTGQEVLLAAATVAAQAPAGTGTYWHVKIDESQHYEYWTKADGHVWFRGAKSGGRVVPLTLPTPFRLGGAEVTMDQIQALPTEPAALRDWITNAVAHSDIRTSAGPLTADQREEAVLEGLVSLVSTLPAPPAVRAASFRAIAAYPGVRAVGAVPGGQGLRVPLPGEGLLVVDPATGRVNQTSTYVTADGAVASAAEGTTIAISAEWTDNLPK